MSLRWRCVTAAAALAIYGASLFAPTISIFASDAMPGHTAFAHAYRTFRALAWGQLDWWIIGGSWLANPALWTATVCFVSGRHRVAFLLAACGTSWAIGILMMGELSKALFRYPGYSLWLSSLLVILVASGLAAVKEWRKAHPSLQITAVS
ncbi:MAG: hypothetical protein DWQ34_12105 [Planctomycetota bacterium]|nr:MAG: hypothetical protein DWQ29_13650 [Planctomycetota bacterium]REJ92937.1 MAG: hypothetical protein DWQ34_12105 [Planctomycetota bacterium]REK26133.1 MAG: hypothetical protein DWQ41_10785 [Planctomycetota bacterium]REK33503.1 MAG: hypothetical protein DWQ45_15055 [Planctomycetota bacterium]